MIGRLLCTLLTASLLTWASAAPSRAADPEIVTYVVQAGDSVWSIAEAFYGDGRKYPLVYRYNKFAGKPPHVLSPGRVLRLPVGEIGPEAQVNWLKRDVKAKPPRSIDWLTARENMNLWRLYKVSTGDESAAHIVFEDTSDLRLRANALLVIYGATSKKSQTKRREKTRIVLERGTLRGGLASLDADSEPMVIETPAGDVGIFGRIAQVQAEAASSAVSVYDGKASLSNAAGAVEIPQDFGTVAEKGKKPRKPKPLPDKPLWASGAGDAVVVVPSGQLGVFDAAWRPVDRAAEYRVELARDEAFKESFFDERVPAEVTRLLTPDLESGQFYARVAARDKDKLEGRPSKPVRVRVVTAQASRALVPTDEGVFEVVGMVRLSLPEAAAPHVQRSVDDGPFGPGAEPVRLDTPGLHVLRYRAADGAPESQLRVRVLAARAAIDAVSGPVPPAGEPVAVSVKIMDELGRPAVIPGVALHAAPGGSLPLEAKADGSYVAEVPIPEGYSAVAVRASWLGGELATHTVTIEAPPVPKGEPYVHRWYDAPIALSWDRRGQATTLPQLVPQTALGVRSSYLDQDLGGVQAQTLALALRGELALMDDDLGLDATMVILRPELGTDSARRNAVGDLTLGARYRLLAEPLQLSASLRVTLPTGGDEGGVSQVGFEPGVLVSIPFTDGFGLDTRQAVVIASDFGDATAIAYAGTYAFVVRPLEWLGITAQLDTAISLSLPSGVDSYVALGAGGGLLFHFERVRLGLVAGAGLNDDGKAQLGSLTAGLTLDVALGGP